DAEPPGTAPTRDPSAATRGGAGPARRRRSPGGSGSRSEEHTSELQSLTNLVCRLLLEKKKNSRLALRDGRSSPSPTAHSAPPPLPGRPHPRAGRAGVARP